MEFRQAMSTSSKGLLAGLSAYALWGLVPFYWKLLDGIPADELLYVRLVLTALTCLVVLRLRGTLGSFTSAIREGPSVSRALLMAVLLAGNWFSFMWAVGNGQILQSSLGYFLCPIVIVLLARFIEREHLGPLRWLAVGFAAAGVSLFIWQAGVIPLAAICIAFTWGGYGLMKKRSAVGPMVALSMETALLSPPAILLFSLLALQGPPRLTSAPPGQLLAISLVGLVTAIPLLLFAYAARRIRLSTLGMGQYIVPSMHFAIALFYGETVTRPILAGFALIWTGLALFSAGGRFTGGPRKAVDPAIPGEDNIPS